MLLFPLIFSALLLKPIIVFAAGNEFPRHLSFPEYKSILSFADDDSSGILNTLNNANENANELSSVWDDFILDNGWSFAEKYFQARKTVDNKSSSKQPSTTTTTILSPYVICHDGMSSLCGKERHDVIDSMLSKKKEEYFLEPVPIYNNNRRNLNKKKKKKEFYGTCFYASVGFLTAKSLDESDILVTPIAPSLKIRKQHLDSGGDENAIDKSTASIAVVLSPGILMSRSKLLEYAHDLQKMQEHDNDSSFLNGCNKDVWKIASVSIGSTSMSSYFFYEFERSDIISGISYRCHRLLIEYLVARPEVISVEKVAQNVLLNDYAQWIVQSSIENERPWFLAGVTGKGQIVQVSDTGVDESSCYLKHDEDESKVMLTTDFDLTPLEEKIDRSKRKIIQYVSIDCCGNGDRTDASSHGTHVVASIAGKRFGDAQNEYIGMEDGIAPDSQISFFDTTNATVVDTKKITIPGEISQMFYFGLQAGAKIHSASWGSNSNGFYTIKSQEVDGYFYNATDKEFVMFIAAGNDGEDGSSTMSEIPTSKNVIAVGASHSFGKDLYGDMGGINYTASFSSRGPTADNRIKPDLVAPGHSILSALANSNGECDPDDPDDRPQYMGKDGKKNYAGLTFKSGTSMACPIAAGSGALVRQYFADGLYEGNPMNISGTLLKAILINGAEEMNSRSKSIYGETGYDPSYFYDEYQGFGRVNLLNSMKHPNETYDSPDLYVENKRILKQNEHHEYEFDVCDNRDFRVTLVWTDPPGHVGCEKCLINDLDLELELDDQIYHPNGKTGKDDRNNVERVILDGFSNVESTVIVRVRASNLGYGVIQKYSLASTGCLNNVEFVTPTPSPTSLCGEDQFEYVLEIFTDRRPKTTSWTLAYQDSKGIIDVGREGTYDKMLNSYIEKGCARYNCFVFIIKDSDFDGLCCARGMGSYQIRTSDKVLMQGDSFDDRQEIEQFCYTTSDIEEPTLRPTATCGDDEFQYEIEIRTDLRPDETRWEIRNAQIDGVERGYYKKSNTEHTYYGSCIDYGCYELTVYDDNFGLCCVDGRGSYQFLVANSVLLSGDGFAYYDKQSFCYWGEETCDDCEEKALLEKISNALSKSGQIFKSESGTLKRMSNLDMVVCDENEFRYDIIIKTDDFPEETSWDLFDENGVLIVNVEEGYYEECDTVNVYPICLIQGCYLFTIKDSAWDGLECDAGYSIKVGDYILAEGDGEFGAQEIKDFCYYGETNFPTTSQSPTPQACDEGQFGYDIIIKTDNNPYETWWELYPENPVVDSVPYMTYTDRLTTYQHFGCGKKENYYEFIIYDQAFDQSGLCCYFGDGSYSLSVDDEVLVKGDQFQDGNYFYELGLPIYFEKKEFYVGNSLTTSNTTTPTLTPELLCGDDQFEYEIEIRTNFFPFETSWNLTYSNGTIIESVEEGEYTIRYYKFVYQGCAFFDCYLFSISDLYGNGLCCLYGNGGYTVKAGEVILAKGGQFSYNETKEFCYGPNITTYPSSQETENPTYNPTPLLVCNSNEFKYDLIITTDLYPNQTSWEFKSEDGTLIDSVEYGYYLDENKDHVQSYCLPMGCFCFTIKDSWVDGLCCYYGIGGYEIKVEDYVLIEGGKFEYNETKDFCYYGETNSPTISESPTIQPTVFVCDDDDSFKYELIISTDYEPESTSWMFLYKYIGSLYGYVDSFYIKDQPFGYEEPNTDYTEYGCAKYNSCFQFQMFAGFYKLTDLNLGFIIAQSTERYSFESFCHYFPLEKAIVTFIISFSNSSTNDDVDIVSTVVTKSIQKILNRASAQIDLPHDINANSLPSSCDDSKCEVNFEVCDGVCDEKSQDKSFLSFVSQALTRESLENGDIFNVMRQTDSTDIFDNVESIDKIELQFDSDFNIGASLVAVQEEEPTECTTPIFQHISRGIISVVSSAMTFVSGLFSNDDDDEDDGLFHFHIEIITDEYPSETSWELRYENGTLIDTSIQTVNFLTYEKNTHTFSLFESLFIDFDYDVYIHPYKLNHDCFKFIIKDSIGDGLCCNYGEGSYRIISRDEIMAQGGEFESHETKRFCSPNFNDQAIELPNTYLIHCNNRNSFKLRVMVRTFFNNPENTRWELYDANGKIIDSIDKGEYTLANATYVQNYCLIDGCYHFKIQGGGWSYYTLYMDDSFFPLIYGFNFWGYLLINAGSATICHPSSLLNGAESVPVCNQHEKFDLEISITGAFDDYFYVPRASWELSYLNGDVIDAAGGANALYVHYFDDDATINGAYVHHNCVKEGWFTFTIRDNVPHDTYQTLFSDVSYKISAGETVLVEGSGCSEKKTERFSYNPSKSTMFCGEDEFKFQVDVTTDEWPHETFWELTHEDGTIVEYAGKRYYTKENTKHIDTYCIHEGCYTFSIHDVLGDGLCCSFGEGSYQIKINNKVIKKGADFGSEETTLIGCPDTT